MFDYHFTKESREDSYLPSCYGTALTTVTVGDKERRLLLYMPRKARANTASVTVLLPNGWTCERALEESNWARLAEEDEHRDKFVVMFLEPENGGSWNLSSAYGEKNEDIDYIRTAIDRIFFACRFIHADIARGNLVGYGEGGTMAQMAVMAYPSLVADFVSIGGAPVSASFAQAASDAICDKLCFYTFSGAKKGILNKQIPVPCWIVDDPEYCAESSAASINYWRETCGCDACATPLSADTVIYSRSTPTPHPLNQDAEAYFVRHTTMPGAVRSMGSMLNRRLWSEMLCRICRHPGDPEGDLHIHEDPVRDCGAEYHYQKVDGWMREWFTYVPESVKKNPDKAVPLVLSIHGYGCSGEYYWNDPRWHKVADERGFIVVCPSGVNGGKYKLPTGETAVMAPSWNQIADPDLPDEFVFFRELVEITCREHAIDRSRIYATGHSNGSTTTHSLGLALPDIFAAVGCVGGAIPVIFHCVLERPEIVNRPDIKVPVWVFGGEEEADIMPAYPEDGNTTAETLNMWMRHNGVAPVSGDGWKAGWVNNGKFVDVCYSDHEKPMVRYTCVRDMPHASTTEISYRLWDEFFSKFSKTPDGEPKFRSFSI